MGVVDPDDEVLAPGRLDHRPAERLEQVDGLLPSLPSAHFGNERCECTEGDRRTGRRGDHPEGVVTTFSCLGEHGPGQEGFADSGLAHEDRAPAPRGA